MRRQFVDKPRNILRGFGYLSLIGVGALGVVLGLWLQPPSLDTYEDECFMSEELPRSDLRNMMTQYLGTPYCRDLRELTAEEQWAVDWLMGHVQSIGLNYDRVHGEIVQLDYMREKCEVQVQRCSGKRAINNLADCFKRRWNNDPWREREKTMDAFIHDRRVQLAAMDGANCIIQSVTRPFYAGCTNGRLPAILTDAECCYSIRRRGLEVQRLLPTYGVSCKGAVTEQMSASGG